jgi:putative hydrolase
VQSNIEKFADDWELPFEDLSYALAVRETVHAAQRSVPWVRDRLVRLATEYVDGYELDVEAFEARLPDQLHEIDGAEDFNPFELIQKLQSGELPGLQMEPTELLASMRTDRQLPVLASLQRFGAVLEGYADAVIDTISTQAGPDRARIQEALQRHRVERGAAADFVDLMLGLQLGRTEYEQGQAFCTGVIERAGIEALNRLWEREAHLPTAAEFEAPGLWLARLELDLDA